MSRWNPDSGDPLTSGEIRVTAVEESAMALWFEFLDGWFDGGTHELRGAFIKIPAATKITFQEMPVQPEDGLYLHVTTERGARVDNRLWGNGQWMITERAQVNFHFRSRVKESRADGHNSLSLVRWGADTLYAILSSQLLTEPLARRGMGVFRPSPPVLVSGGTIAMRRISLNVIYTYSNQEATLTTVPSITTDVSQSVVYIGREKTVRITPQGLERKGDDGNWYVIDVDIIDTYPVLGVSPAV